MIKKIIFCAFCVFLLPKTIIADTGCRITYGDGTRRVFPTTSDPAGNSNYIVQNNHTTDCAGQPSSRRYVLSGELISGGSCNVTGQGNGTFVTYPRYYNCPIDGHNLILLLTAGGIALMFLRKNTTMSEHS